MSHNKIIIIIIIIIAIAGEIVGKVLPLVLIPVMGKAPKLLNPTFPIKQLDSMYPDLLNSTPEL